MSTWINRTRKRRITRDLTITTLTDSSKGSFQLSPALSAAAGEEPLQQGSLMSSPFSATSSLSNTPGSAPQPTSLQMSANFTGFPYNYMSPISAQSFSSQQQQISLSLPTGKNDLEILEKLKDTIKSNQHEIFRPVPQPAVLASIYLGPRSASHVPPHPEQIPSAQLISSGGHPHSSWGEGYQSITNAHTGRADTDTKGSAASYGDVGTRKNAQGLEEPWEDTRKSGAPSTAPLPDPSATLDNPQPFSAGNSLPPASQSILGSPDKSMDMDPPGLGNVGLHTNLVQRTPQRDIGPPNSTTPRAGAISTRDYQSQSLSRSATERSFGEPSYGSRSLGQLSPSKSSLDRKQDSLGPRDTSWISMKSSTSQEEIKSRQELDRLNTGRAGDHARMSGTESYRIGQRYSRDFDRERDRERSRERDSHWDRDHDRDRRPEHGRLRDDRRNDERPRYTENRRPPPEERHYEPRYDSNRSVDLPRRWDSKSSVDSNMSSKHLPEDRDVRTSRPLEAERSFEFRGARPPGDERSLSSRLPPLDERRPLGSTSDDGPNKPGPPPDDRRPQLPIPDRLVRPVDDRRPPPPPAVSDRPIKPHSTDERRLTGPPLTATSSATSLSDRIGRTAGNDDRHARQPSPQPRLSGATSNPSIDYRLPPVSGDRPARPLGEDAKRPADGYPTRSEAATSVPVASSASSSSRPLDPPRQVPLEERISRQPSLQERLGGRPGDPPKANIRPPEERKPVNTLSDKPPIKLEERVATLPPASDPVNRAPLTDTSRIPPQPENRGRPQAPPERFSPAGAVMGDKAPPTSNNSNTQPPRPPVSRDDPMRTLKPRPDISPRRNEYRPHPPPEHMGRPERFERDRSRDKRPDTIKLDPPRFNDRPPPGSYQRPSPPSYNRQDRPWVPPNEPYGNNVARRPPQPASATAYGHDWQEGNRGYGDWERRGWERDRALDRDRDYDRERDNRFIERDTVPVPSWETREEREHRLSSVGFVPPSADGPPSRTYDTRPLSARLSDGYPPVEERDRPFDRPRYPPVPLDSSAVPYSRVRPRSPSPLRRGMDDLRPPIKRPRDDAYGPGYYSPPGLEPPRDYSASRMRSPPAGVSTAYYNEPRPDFNGSSVGPPRDRDRDYGNRDGYGGYPHDRRDPGPIGRSPTRPPPSFGRGGYDRRYSVPPRG